MSNGDSDGDGGGGDGDANVKEQDNLYLPRLWANSAIPHYYGDYVRQIFITVGAIMLVIAPFLVSRGAAGLVPFEIAGAIILVFLAAITTPKKQWVLMADAIAAAAGVLVFEILALGAYAAESWFAFIALEGVTIAFLFALYFSLKTVRNMILGQVKSQVTSAKR
jgi:hypothetical protein